MLFIITLLSLSVSNAEYGWVREAKINDIEQESGKTRLIYKDSLNYILLESEGQKIESEVFIEGDRNSSLESNINGFYSESRNLFQLEMYYDYMSDRFILSNRNKLAQIILKDAVFSEYSQDINPTDSPLIRLFETEGPFGDIRFLNYLSDINEIHLYHPRATRIIVDTILRMGPDFGNIRSMDIDPITQRMIVFSVKPESGSMRMDVGIYKGGEMVSSFPFDDDFISLYGPQITNQITISDVHHLSNNNWIIVMDSKGYFISEDNGDSWDHIALDEDLDLGGSGVYNTPNDDKLFVSGYQDQFLTTVIEDNQLSGQQIKFWDQEYKQVQVDQLYPDINIYSTPFNTYLYDGTQWVYKLEQNVVSVEEDLAGKEELISLQEYLNSNSEDILTVYSTDGKLLYKQNARELRTVIPTLTGKYIIVSSSGNVFKISR
jgi:hypothetical protein